MSASLTRAVAGKGDFSRPAVPLVWAGAGPRPLLRPGMAGSENFRAAAPPAGGAAARGVASGRRLERKIAVVAGTLEEGDEAVRQVKPGGLGVDRVLTV